MNVNIQTVFLLACVVLVSAALTWLPGWNRPKTKIGTNAAGRRFLTESQFALVIAAFMGGTILMVWIVNLIVSSLRS